MSETCLHFSDKWRSEMNDIPLEGLKQQLEMLRYSIKVREDTISSMRDEIAYLDSLNNLDMLKSEKLVEQIDEFEKEA